MTALGGRRRLPEKRSYASFKSDDIQATPKHKMEETPDSDSDSSVDTSVSDSPRSSPRPTSQSREDYLARIRLGVLYRLYPFVDKATLEGIKPPTSEPCPPSSWRWSCHRCGRSYLISTTRRCLNCSHRFCAGKYRINKAGKRELQVSPCPSEFDFAGWREWGMWRRALADRQGQDILRVAGKYVGALSYAFGPEIQYIMSKDMDDEMLLLLRDTQRFESLYTKRHDCAADCDYPKQCAHVYLGVKRAQTLQSDKEGRVRTLSPVLDDEKEAAPATSSESHERDADMVGGSAEGHGLVGLGVSGLGELPGDHERVSQEPLDDRCSKAGA